MDGSNIVIYKRKKVRLVKLKFPYIKRRFLAKYENGKLSSVKISGKWTRIIDGGQDDGPTHPFYYSKKEKFSGTNLPKSANGRRVKKWVHVYSGFSSDEYVALLGAPTTLVF